LQKKANKEVSGNDIQTELIIGVYIMSSLMLDRNFERVSRSFLQTIETPVGTKTHRPLSHYDTATKIVETAQNRGFSIQQEEYGLNPTGSQVFAMLHLQDGDDEKKRMISFRNSHVKSFSFSICVGFKICICSNMMMSSDIGVRANRRHTKNIESDIEGIITQTFDQLPAEYDMLEQHISRLKSTKLDINRARIIVMQSIEQRMIRPSDGLQVIKEFKAPRHEQFVGDNAWNLYNAYTEIVRDKYSPAKADNAYRGLSKLFHLNGATV
jgi:uncharacterized protein DUF932